METLNTFISTPIVYQTIGLIGMVISCAGCLPKNPRIIIALFLISNIVWMVHYLGIGAIAAFWMSLFISTRMLIGLIVDDKWLKRIIPGFVFFSFSVVIFNFNGWYDLFLIPATALGHLQLLYRDNGPLFRVSATTCMISWLVYHSAIFSIGGIINDAIQIVLLIFAIWLHDRQHYLKKFRLSSSKSK